MPIPWWVTTTYVAFLVWTVVNAHHPALFIGGFLFFLGFDRATAEYSTLEDFKTPLLVGFFLAALVIHGGLQGWWIAPVLSRLARVPLFAASSILTAFNDNALITYLATLVPDLDQSLEAGHRAGSGDRRGLDGDWECPESGRTGLARAVLHSCHPTAAAARRRAGSHADCRRAFPGVSDRDTDDIRSLGSGSPGG